MLPEEYLRRHDIPLIPVRQSPSNRLTAFSSRGRFLPYGRRIFHQALQVPCRRCFLQVGMLRLPRIHPLGCRTDHGRFRAFSARGLGRAGNRKCLRTLQQPRHIRTSPFPASCAASVRRQRIPDVNPSTPPEVAASFPKPRCPNL